MTNTAASPASPPRAVDVPRRASRGGEDGIVSGVAAGLAHHLGVPVVWVRAGFLLALAVGGLGALVYAGLWMFLPAEEHLTEGPAGLDAATRQGKRRPRLARRLADSGPLVAIAAVGVGVLALVSALTGRSLVTGPLVLAIAGVGVLWWQADEAQRDRWRDSTGRLDLARALVGSGGWRSWVRVVVGLGMLVVAIVTFTLRSGNFSAALDVGVAALLGILGVGFILGPWLIRLSADLGEEREARVRSQERADVAAHLHDSVLQTLALIQRSAGDPAAVARLARAQERDLRSWLYDAPTGETVTLAAALRRAAAEAEDAYGVPVEVVCVGDHPVTEPLRPLVLAAREAISNAARHSGADKVDVYAESGPDRSEVFVRDRGKGFDITTIAADRHGVRGSIVDRMQRHGGTAEVLSTPGVGTEVRLGLPHPEEEQG
jgi:signal transduction histidine kinase